MAVRASYRQLPTFQTPPAVLVLVAPYYRGIADMQLAGARAVLAAAGAAEQVLEVPGALEIAPAIRFAAEARRFEAYVALGCVIRGATTHYEIVCNESARGITLLGVQAGLAIGNGILTCETEAQAEERADPARLDKGGDAAEAALRLAALARRFRTDPGPGGLDHLFAGAGQFPRTA
ncbi:MAG: 6,7-dimethyl-8-ribityllumazine synthase [Paracoccaceae bacterium]